MALPIEYEGKRIFVLHYDRNTFLFALCILLLNDQGCSLYQCFQTITNLVYFLASKQSITLYVPAISQYNRMHCPLYNIHRQQLVDSINELNIEFTIQTTLYGSETSDYNVKPLRAVHSFIKRSKRFDNNIVI